MKRKIKANQAQELLSLLSSERLSEEDAATFLSRFDRAFLDLYPTFPQELNALLLPDCQIIQPSSYAMTTEQRIMALVRLGVNESAEIANLLFYSPQPFIITGRLSKQRLYSKSRLKAKWLSYAQ